MFKYITPIINGRLSKKVINLNRLTMSFGGVGAHVQLNGCNKHIMDMIFLKPEDTKAIVRVYKDGDVKVNDISVLGATQIENGDILTIESIPFLYYVNKPDQRWEELNKKKRKETKMLPYPVEFKRYRLTNQYAAFERSSDEESNNSEDESECVIVETRKKRAEESTKESTMSEELIYIRSDEE